MNEMTKTTMKALVILGLMSRLAFGQLDTALDCTTDASLGDVAESDLRGPSEGTLADGSFRLFLGPKHLSVDEPVVLELGLEESFSILRAGSLFEGFLVRVVGQGFQIFLQDDADVGKVSFCEGLGLLDTNSSNVNLAPQFALVQAGFKLFFGGSSRIDAVMDVVASVSSGSSYEYYYDRFDVAVVKTTDSPTQAPSSSPSKAPSAAPTTETPTSSPTGQPSSSPNTSSPTHSPTNQPSTAPSIAPVTVSPSRAPSRPPSTAPTVAPTFRSPTSLPTASPSTVPTKTPTVSPTIITSTKHPTVSPTATTASSNPTSSPTTFPTATPSARPTTQPTEPFIEATINNLELTLVGVSSLNDEAQAAFVSVTTLFYNNIYYQQSPGRRGRALQAAGVVDFSTTVTFESQTISANSNTVTYTQSIAYRKLGASVDPLDGVLLSPFSNPTLRKDYFAMLRDSHPAYSNLPNGFVAQPQALVEDETPNDSGEDGGGGGTGLIVVVALGAVAGLLSIAILLLLLHRRRKKAKEEGPKHMPLDKHEHATLPSSAQQPTTELIIGEDEVSALYTPSLDAYSYEAENSMSTVDYDYSKVATGGGNRSVVSSSGGTMGDNDTRQDSLSKVSSERGRWAKLGPKYTDENHIYTIEAPAGKLGVVVDTPDEGPPVIHAVKPTSVLAGKVNVGDRLLAVDDEDVTQMSAVNISRMISRKAEAPVRNFTLKSENTA